MKVNDVLEVKIIDVDLRGNGIAKVSNLVVFVPYALENEIVKIKIVEIKKRYVKANLIEILKTSNKRTKVACPSFFHCGGCKFLHTTYENELEIKMKFLHNLFPNIKINDIASFKPLEYRNKITVHVKNGKLGFFQEETNELVEINDCLLISDSVKKLLDLIKKCELSKVSEIVIKENSNLDLMLIINGKLLEKDIEKIKPYVNVFYLNELCISSNHYLIEFIDDKKFIIGKDSFFQVNYEMMLALYKMIKDYIGKGKNLLDLYCGIGTISLYLCHNFSNVLGIEIVPEAIKCANLNLQNNNIHNVSFLCDDASNLKKNYYDKIVVDPPRKGLSKKVLNKILEIEPKTIVYVSCNPLTLKRDMEFLKEKYEVLELSPFDMFPKTSHIECVCVLKTKYFN